MSILGSKNNFGDILIGFAVGCGRPCLSTDTFYKTFVSR